jgi:dissimilatory sulfite reductase (desulfoviridin) alpha/beta subunit
MTDRVTDIGPPHYEQLLPPIIKDNYGKWKYHEYPRAGCHGHVGESGDKLYTVRAGSPRLVSIDKIRKYCDLADKYCDGHLRFTSRNNVEFLLTDESKIDRSSRISTPSATRSAASATRSRASSTPRAGCTATRPRPTPPASSRRSWTR